jgi:hypothetical protein
VKSFTDAVVALNSLKSEGVVEDYAIVGAMALLFWTEPIPTFDLDVLVLLPPNDTPLVSLDGIYRWAASRGYPSTEEHIIIEGVPTQFLPSPNALADEVIARAAVLDYSGIPVRVARPEYLVALYLEPGARTAKRQARAAALMELPSLSRELVNDILDRYGLAF